MGLNLDQSINGVLAGKKANGRLFRLGLARTNFDTQNNYKPGAFGLQTPHRVLTSPKFDPRFLIAFRTAGEISHTKSATVRKLGPESPTVRKPTAENTSRAELQAPKPNRAETSVRISPTVRTCCFRTVGGFRREGTGMGRFSSSPPPAVWNRFQTVSNVFPGPFPTPNTWKVESTSESGNGVGSVADLDLSTNSRTSFS